MVNVTIEMPVTRAAFLRAETERQLSFTAHIARTLPSSRPVAATVRAPGCASRRRSTRSAAIQAVEPNPDGTGKPYQPSGWQPGDPFPDGGFHSGGGGGVRQGRILLAGLGDHRGLALGLTALGVLPAPLALLLLALAIVVVAVCGYAWARLCRGRFVLLPSSTRWSWAAWLRRARSPSARRPGIPVRMAALALAGLIAVAAILASC